MKVRIGILSFFTFILFPLASAHSYGWGFKPVGDEKLPDVGIYADIIKNHYAFYADFTDEKEIYLTFDNGYEQGYTASILNVLKKHDVPATFFVTGHYVKSEPKLVARMVDEGHIIGNHSYNHPDFTKMSKEEIEKELTMVEETVSKVSNQKEMIYLRPPRGTFNEQTLKWATELGYIHIFWSIAFKDWETNRQRGWEYAYNQLMKQAHPGAIILLHTVSEDNALALEKAIVDLKQRGYSFKSLDDLMIKYFFDQTMQGIIQEKPNLD